MGKRAKKKIRNVKVALTFGVWKAICKVPYHTIELEVKWQLHAENNSGAPMWYLKAVSWGM